MSTKGTNGKFGSINGGPFRVEMGGSRGSLPVAGIGYTKHGGNTTCIRVISECLPADMALIVDGGTGFLPVSMRALNQGARRLMILLTHHHHDHSQGFFIAPATFIPTVQKIVWGPVELATGPEKAFRTLMAPPFHPVDFSTVAGSFSFKDILRPRTCVILFHPLGGGPLLLAVDKLEKIKNGSGMVRFAPDNIQKLSECLLVRMYYSNHPERTICYRFEELTTGKVFVFLTDNENTVALPAPFQAHLENTDLLIMDSQYSENVYHARTKGFGHATPSYCVETAIRCGSRQLGLTHHDPTSNDEYLVNTILAEAMAELARRSANTEVPINLSHVFLCEDGQVMDV
jgi:ribonuclease BN (tRNA processing enzyme)